MGKPTMTLCLLCVSPTLDPLYQPIGTRRDISIFVCEKCGLLQSLPRNTKGDGIARVSHNSDYGNLRIFKGQRSQSNLDFLRRNTMGFKPERVLDVGASRGAFARELRGWLPQAHIIAVEPDTSVWPVEDDDSQLAGRDSYEAWKNKRIEQMDLGENFFDLEYISHTLEHLDSPFPTLQKLRQALSPDGWLLVEVPNIRGLMGIIDVCEEVYLDKHNIHLSLNTLRKMLGVAGFHPKFYLADTENLTVLAQRGEVTPIPNDYEASSIRPMVQAYASDLIKNREALKGKVWRLNRLIKNEGRPALISGGGRILSALVEAGLDTLLFEGVVDPWLPLDEVHGLPVLSNPKMIGYVKPKVVLICSRSSAEAMAGEAVGWMPGVRVLRWNQ